jgi:hypothetical protein
MKLEIETLGERIMRIQRLGPNELRYIQNDGSYHAIYGSRNVLDLREMEFTHGQTPAAALNNSSQPVTQNVSPLELPDWGYNGGAVLPLPMRPAQPSPAATATVPVAPKAVEVVRNIAPLDVPSMFPVSDTRPVGAKAADPVRNHSPAPKHATTARVGGVAPLEEPKWW